MGNMLCKNQHTVTKFLTLGGNTPSPCHMHVCERDLPTKEFCRLATFFKRISPLLPSSRGDVLVISHNIR